MTARDEFEKYYWKKFKCNPHNDINNYHKEKIRWLEKNSILKSTVKNTIDEIRCSDWEGECPAECAQEFKKELKKKLEV